MNFREVKENDYKEITSWWKKWGKKAPDHEYYEGALGIMISRGEKNLSAVFLYEITEKGGQLGFMVTNPDITRKVRLRALKFAMEIGTGILRKLGKRFIQIVTDEIAVTKIGVAMGYMPLKATHYLMMDFKRGK